MTKRIDALLSTRLYLNPQWAGDDLYFISNLSGRLSLYRMDGGQGIPQPFLPPSLALPNPELIGGAPFCVFPRLNQILVMIDHEGDEIYQPYFIPMDGGFPEPLLPEVFAGSRSHCEFPDERADAAFFVCESLAQAVTTTCRVDLSRNTAETIAQSEYGFWPIGTDELLETAVLAEGYTVGDVTLHLWKRDTGLMRLYGTRLPGRTPGEPVPLSGFGSADVTDTGHVLVTTTLYDDQGGIACLHPSAPDETREVAIVGTLHTGQGELETIAHRYDNRFTLRYNIDGATWLYEATFDQPTLTLTITRALIGEPPLDNGVALAHQFDRRLRRDAISFSTATRPVQIFSIDALGTHQITNERILGLPGHLLSSGEDASFVSHDGLRISARLYLPSPELGFSQPFPLVYYVHGGPQSQERPDFVWFSMPLIQFLTLKGFAVFVPNARGSTGYGLSYTKHVDHDWGGQDRLDHVHAMGLLRSDPRIDTSRAGVVGRSYGGYMSLTLATRHPELWKGAVDMFGPYDLLTFGDRIPETWKPYFAIALGNPVTERDFLIERSPSTYIEQITCPLLIIQGRNDPRVVAQESIDLVERLKQLGKQAEILIFEDEGHDVLKFENRVTCYNAIEQFFQRTLNGKSAN